MDSLISRQAAIELIHSLYPSAPIMPMNRKRWKKKYKPYIEAEKALEMLPSAQPEIIRCKDCKHRYVEDMIWHCPFGLMGGENFFCGYGSLGTVEMRRDG